MHSPVRTMKKSRKPNTFSQTAIPSEVGEFQQGYFVMPTETKENVYPHSHPLQPTMTTANAKVNKKAVDVRSPARRKHQTPNEFTAPPSPTKERGNNINSGAPNKQYELQDFKKPYSSIEVAKNANSIYSGGKCNELMTPQSFSSSITKSSPKQIHPTQIYDMIVKNASTPSKDPLSCSPTGSGRWAGPAFGNAPPPSSLPLPEFPPMNSFSQETFLSQSPPAHDRGPFIYSPVTSPHHHHFSAPSPNFSSIPVVPFPYVGPAPPSSLSPPSLAQLSTDLRRMLNINDVPSSIMVNDQILVSANSS